MSELGRTCVVIHSTSLTLTAVMFLSSYAGFAGDWEMIAAAVLSLVLWGVFGGFTIHALVVSNRLRKEDGSPDKTLDWTRGLLLTGGILGAVAGWVAAPFAFATCGPTWLAPLYHWGGLLIAGLGFFGYFVFPSYVRGELGEYHGHAQPPSLKAILWTTLPLFGFWALVWVTLVFLLMNTMDEDDYLSQAQTGFSLPYPEGTTAWVVQGASSSANHSDNHAYDFRLQCGTDILASADGEVTRAVDKHDGHLGDADDNVIEITAGDVRVQYGHIKQHSLMFKKGETVRRGQKIAEVGNVGNSLTQHIHWEVYVDGKTTPSTFVDADVKGHEGIPRSLRYYTSSNKPVAANP